MTLQQLRMIALIEGTTLLLLFFVAMPLKYRFDLPIAVSIMGPIHGIAFIIYIVALTTAFSAKLITHVKMVIGTIAALIPFGSFVFERVSLKKT